MQWGHAVTNRDWNTKIPFNRTFTTVGAVNLTIYNDEGTPTSSTYRDYGGIKYYDKTGFYGGFNVVGYKFFWMAIGIS